MLTHEAGELTVAEAALLGLEHVECADVAQALRLQPALRLVHLPELGHEPGVDLGVLEDVLLAEAVLEGLRAMCVVSNDLLISILGNPESFVSVQHISEDIDARDNNTHSGLRVYMINIWAAMTPCDSGHA